GACAACPGAAALCAPIGVVVAFGDGDWAPEECRVAVAGFEYDHHQVAGSASAISSRYGAPSKIRPRTSLPMWSSVRSRPWMKELTKRITQTGTKSVS